MNGKGQAAGEAAGGAVVGVGAPAKGVARRFSDTGTSALRPPLPPQRSRLGHPPTPTAQQAAAHPVGSHHNQQHHSPFATPSGAAAVAGDVSVHAPNGVALHSMGSTAASSGAVPGAGLVGMLSGAACEAVDASARAHDGDLGAADVQ